MSSVCVGWKPPYWISRVKCCHYQVTQHSCVTITYQVEYHAVVLRDVDDDDLEEDDEVWEA